LASYFTTFGHGLEMPLYSKAEMLQLLLLQLTGRLMLDNWCDYEIGGLFVEG